MVTLLKLYAPGTSPLTVEQGLAFARARLIGLDNSLAHVFLARAQIRSRGADRYPDCLGIGPSLIADTVALEQAEAIALITCYGRGVVPDGSGLVLDDGR